MWESDSYDMHNEGNSLYRKGDYVGAIDCYTRALLLDKSLLETYFNRALAYTKLEQYEDALDDLKSCLELDAHVGEVYYLIGLVYQYMEEYVESVQWYLKAIEKDPGYENAVSQFTRLLHKISTLDEIPAELETYLDTMLEMEQKEIYLNAHILKSHLAFARYDMNEAERHLLEALEKAPDEMVVCLNLGRLYRKIGNATEAIQYYQLASQQDPSNINSLQALGELNMEQSLYEESETYFRRVLSLDPVNAEAYESLGDLYQSLSEHERAIASYRLALSSDPDKTGAMYELACLLRSEYPEISYCLLKKILEKDKEHQDANEEIISLKWQISDMENLDCDSLLDMSSDSLDIDIDED